MTPPVFVMGDVHGQIEKLTRLLREAGLLGPHRRWAGADARLWFIGDFFDRGPDGIGCLELAMSLQREAAKAGGEVGALLGNHEIGLLSAHRLGAQRSSGPGGTFRADWETYGGNPRDLAGLKAEHIRWIEDLPAMARVAGRLLIHADSLLYREYGATLEAVNRAFEAVVRGSDAAAWDALLSRFSDRGAFADGTPGGSAAAAGFLRQYNGRQIIHGHTPIPRATGCPAGRVREPYAYAGGLCLNVDSGMYLGGDGFLAILPGGTGALG